MTTQPKPEARIRRRRRTFLAVLAALLVYPTVTYIQALNYPGNSPFADRTVGWVRDMGLGDIVNTIENWWYTRKSPSTSNPAASALPPLPTGSPTAVAGEQPNSLPVNGQPLTGEGVWTPGTRTADGQAADFTTFIRPDSAHASVVAGVAWLNQHLTRTTLIPGTKEPGRTQANAAHVPDNLRSRLLATFNSGFMFKDTRGGFYLDGTYKRPLRDGNASVVIDNNGVVSIVQWGRDVTMNPNIRAVRQNLELVVDNGTPVTGLADNTGSRWGNARSQFQYTWRSGLGTDTAGHLIYVAGNQLTLTTLADAMAQAGIVRGMQLDIHSDMVTFNTYRPDQPSTAPAKLLPTMTSPADRYLQPDQRDFFAVAIRPASVPSTKNS